MAARSGNFYFGLRLVDMFYLLSESENSTHGKVSELLASFSWMDVVAPVAVGGIWLWYFSRIVKTTVVPINDPYLPNAIKHGKGH